MSDEPSIDAIPTLGAPPAADYARPGGECAPTQPGDRVTAQLGAVGALLSTLEGSPPPVLAPPVVLDTAELAMENELVQVRLGIASSLFAALRAKHAPTAHHSLRVALGCSAWSAMLGLADDERSALEVASLLHDLGKIGVADSILLKPAGLTPDEYHVIERHRHVGTEILRNCCASPGVLEIVRHAGDWFDGSREGATLKGEQLLSLIHI